MGSIFPTLIVGLVATVILLIVYGLTNRSWVGYAVMPRRGAVIEPLGSETLTAELLWPAIVERDHNRWLTVGKVRIRAVDVVRSDHAEEYYSAWIAAEPQDAQPRLLRAMLLASLPIASNALEDCLEAVRLDAQNPTSHFLLGKLEHGHGDPHAALERYDEALRLRSHFVGAYVGRGDAWAACREPNNAIADYSRALDFDWRHVPAWYGRGCIHYAHGDYTAAIEDFSHVIDLDPQKVYAYHNRATARHAIGDLDHALDDIDNALSFTSRDPTLFIARAAIYQALGQPDLAINDLNQAIRLDSGEVEAFCRRGALWLATGEYGRAAEDFADAVAIDPTFAQALDQRAWLLATCPDDEFRDGHAALVLAREACRLTEYKNVDFLDTLAATLAAVGEFGEACDWQRSVIMRIENDESFLSGARSRLTLYARGSACFDVQKSFGVV